MLAGVSGGTEDSPCVLFPSSGSSVVEQRRISVCTWLLHDVNVNLDFRKISTSLLYNRTESGGIINVKVMYLSIKIILLF